MAKDSGDKSALNSLDISPDEVRRRFSAAKQAGNPAWLWPEVTIQQWRTALDRIETIVRGKFSRSSDVDVLDGDPAAIGLAGYTSGLGPLLGLWLERGSLTASAPVVAILELHLRHNRLRTARMEVGAVGIVETLLDRGVPVTVLKGAHTGRGYFPEPGARPASDVDLLVHAADRDRAELAMRETGFVEKDRGSRESSWRPACSPTAPRSLMLAHADDPWSVDLHSSLNIFVSAAAPLAHLDAGSPMSGARPWAPWPGASVLDQPLLLLHLAVHASSGFQNLTLLRLVEIALVIDQDTASGLLTWDGFLAMGERTRSLGFAYPALRLCEMLTPERMPPHVLERCRREAPAGVMRIVDRLTPASAQRIDRTSVTEHFMWARGWTDVMRQIALDLAPAAGSWSKTWSIYETRAWRVLRGSFSR